MNQTELLEKLESVPKDAAFTYRTGRLSILEIRTGAGELCAEAAREISRLKADVNHWREARRVAISCGEILQEEMKKLRDELEALKRERDVYQKALKEIADEQFGTVDECIEFADRCIRQMGGYR
jgi:chromosome segregation ATPase